MLTEKVFPVHPKVGLELVGTTDLWYAQGGIDGLAFNQPTNQLFAFWALVIAMLATRVCNSAHQLTKLMHRRSITMYFWMYTCKYDYYIHITHTLLLEAAAITENKKKHLSKTQPFLICIFWVPLTTKDFLTLANEAFLLTSRSHRRFDQYNFITCQMGGAQATVRNISANVIDFKGVKVCQGLCQCVQVHVFVGCVFCWMLDYSDSGAQSSWLDKTHQLFILKTLQQTPHFLLIPARSFWYRDPRIQRFCRLGWDPGPGRGD